MPKINIGGSYENSKLALDAEISAASTIEIVVGDGHDMSQRQIKIIERDATATSQEIANLRDLSQQLAAKMPENPNALKASKEALDIAATADQIQQNRKWYSVSAKGLIEAAEAVGSAASPILKTALNVIRMLSEAKTQA